MTTGTPSSIIEAATALLRSGKVVEARTLLEQSPSGEAGLSHSGAWLLAQICRRMEDVAGEIAALQSVLHGAPRDIPALLAMGAALRQQGDDRSAMAWLTLALNQARITPAPPQLTPLLQQAERFCIETQQQFSQHMTDEIIRTGLNRNSSPALSHAIDLLLGKQQLFLQQPSMFYYPGLPQRPFYERDEFSWVAGIEQQCADLRDEFLSLSKTAQPFSPYVERSSKRPAPNNPLLEDPSWGAAYLWRDGAETDLGQRASVTMAALATAPVPHIKQRSPMALYSRLTPSTHIAPHHGLLNTRLICHLPLVAPDGCALRVGHETRAWRFGEMLIFDDSFEHEAWNRGASDRTIILFEIWRPEIPQADREALAVLFEAIDRVDPAQGRETA